MDVFYFSNEAEVWPLFQVSYMWYTLLGASMSILVALAVSLLNPSEETNQTPHKLFSPLIHKFLSPEREKVSVVLTYLHGDAITITLPLHYNI